MKDYINVLNDKNQVLTMEVVTTFKIDQFPFNYLIYKERDDSHFYIAKYSGTDVVELDTDFSKEELKLTNIIFEEAMNNARS